MITPRLKVLPAQALLSLPRGLSAAKLLKVCPYPVGVLRGALLAALRRALRWDH